MPYSLKKNIYIYRCDTVPGNLPQFDVYAPNSSFKKTRPGIPDFRVKVVRYVVYQIFSVSFPTLFL
jgi:hypothetical protein